MSTTLLTFALLLFAASIASYGLSAHLASRDKRGAVVVGFSVGTALLLAAVLIVVGSTNSWFATRLSAALSSDTTPSSADRMSPFVRSDVPRESAFDPLTGHTASVDAAPGRTNDARMIVDRSEPRLPQLHEEPATSAALLGSHPTSARSHAIAGIPASRTLMTHPFSATDCIAAIQPDPAEPTRWWLENECDAAVAILFSARGATSWTYLNHAMLLPAKFQRFTPHSEETQHGEEIRFIACALTSASLIALIIDGRGSRSESEWRRELDAAGADDDCFTGIERWATLGRQSGRTIEQLIGPHVPGRIRTAR